MVTLNHAVKVRASRARTYKALTELTEMAAWHVGSIEGEIAQGEVMTLLPKPGQRFGWRTERLETDSKIVQAAVEGSDTSPGKTLTFSLSDLEDGRTLVELTDGEWREGDPNLPFCNAHWGEVLFRLKNYVEKA
jgi:uncharacterized protein YndB with AHSA1/START domain